MSSTKENELQEAFEGESEVIICKGVNTPLPKSKPQGDRVYLCNGQPIHRVTFWRHRKAGCPQGTLTLDESTLKDAISKHSTRRKYTKRSPGSKKKHNKPTPLASIQQFPLMPSHTIPAYPMAHHPSESPAFNPNCTTYMDPWLVPQFPGSEQGTFSLLRPENHIIPSYQFECPSFGVAPTSNPPPSAEFYDLMGSSGYTNFGKME